MISEALQGKRVTVRDVTGGTATGLCSGCADDRIKIIPDNEKDEVCYMLSGLVSYSIVGGGSTGGYSGLNAYVCKNESINCRGRVRVCAGECHISEMGCEMISDPKAKAFHCDFGCIGPVEILPSRVQRSLFDGMTVDRRERKNYLDGARKSIEREFGTGKDAGKEKSK